MKKFVIFFTITLPTVFLSISGMEPKVSNNMELEKPDKKRKIATLGEPSQEARKYIKKTPSLSHMQYDEFHRDIVRLIRKAYKKEKFHKQTSELLQTLQNFSQLYPTEYLGFLGVVSILHSLIKQKTVNYDLIQYLLQQPKLLEVQLYVKDSNGNSLEECIKKRKDTTLGELFTTAISKSIPREEAEFEELVSKTPSFACEEKIVCGWNNCSKEYDTYPQFDDHFKKEHKPKLTSRDNKFYCQWIIKNGALCGKTCSTQKCLIEHINIHTGKYKCDHSGCNKSFAQKGHLTDHKRTHTGERPYTCDYLGCGKSFIQKGNLTTHKRTHTGERPYICDYLDCGKSFTQKSYLTTHKRIHTGERPYICDYLGCGKSFTQKGNLKAHHKIHNPENPVKCHRCNRTFKNKQYLKHHLKTHSLDKYKCPATGCNREYVHKHSLKKHMKLHENKKVKKTSTEKAQKPLYNRMLIGQKIVCKWDNCSTKFDTYAQFNEHLNCVHLPTSKGTDKKFHCRWKNNSKMCIKSFTGPSFLKIHIRSHTGEKPFKCDHTGCEKAFSIKRNLKRHQKKHIKKKTIVCKWEHCTEKLATYRDFNQHLKDKHLKESIDNDKKFYCKWVHNGVTCTNVYSKLGTIIKHMNTHTERFKCSKCLKTFHQNINLKNHMKTHTGERPFKCPYPDCPWAFSTKSNLTRHCTSVHTNKKPYKCDYVGCDKSFGRSDELKMHKLYSTEHK